MHIEVFEKLLNLNRNFERVIVNLKHLESVEGFGKTSVEKFRLEAERLRAGINRYVSEQIGDDADKECERLNPLVYPQKPETEEAEGS